MKEYANVNTDRFGIIQRL